MSVNQRLFAVTRLALKIAVWFCWFLIVVLTVGQVAAVLGTGALLLAPDMLTHLGIPVAMMNVPLLPILGVLLFALGGGLVCMIFVLLAVRATAGIVDTAIAGDPFVRENAERLKRIGWCMLGVIVVQFLALIAAAAITPEHLPEGMHLGTGAEPDPVSLLAVLLIFVLASIFRHGSDMREELEGTV